MGALDSIEQWPVATAAAGVTRTGGGASTHGPADRPFPIASITKVLVALCVLVAVEEGSMALEDPAGPPGATIRHLLAHASGLAPEGDQVLAPPGRRRIYSNRGFEILGTTLEESTGFGLRQYLAEAVVAPLGLRATVLEGSAASGATSSADDLLVVAHEFLEPTLVAPTTIEEATAVAFPGTDGVLPGFGPQHPNDWGLGVEIKDGKAPHWTGARNAPSTFGHFGRSGTMLWVDPDAGVGCVALTDRAFDTWAAEAWPAFSDAVLGECLP